MSDFFRNATKEESDCVDKKEGQVEKSCKTCRKIGRVSKLFYRCEFCEDFSMWEPELELTADEIKTVSDGALAIRVAKSLPPITPQPKIGHWIDEFGGCKCSECGCLEGGYSNYCPNCGAKMESEEEE